MFLWRAIRGRLREKLPQVLQRWEQVWVWLLLHQFVLFGFFSKNCRRERKQCIVVSIIHSTLSMFIHSTLTCTCSICRPTCTTHKKAFDSFHFEKLQNHCMKLCFCILQCFWCEDRCIHVMSYSYIWALSSQSATAPFQPDSLTTWFTLINIIFSGAFPAIWRTSETAYFLNFAEIYATQTWWN
jgi:hypothetical protein